MIMFVSQAFTKHPELLSEYQEKIQYFLVDEYQDTNAAQNSIVDQLASFWGEQANVFVVGDPHQSIFRFQGASIENMVSFQTKYPTAEIISLSIGYRCGQKVYDAAGKLIENNGLTAGQNEWWQAAHLQSASGPGQPIQIAAFPSQLAEAVGIAENIKKLVADGISLEDIAVLVRNNKDITDLQIIFDQWQINYQLDTGNNLLKISLVMTAPNWLFVSCHSHGGRGMRWQLCS
jgi:DNA helicase-2/ATP-dependent DNA helicase PcrA